MYIEPSTNIRILKNVHLDNSYMHTIYFESETEQHNYFLGKQKYNLSNYTYQRANKNTIRVNIVADNLYDCNYIMFKNTLFGDKWFYAFITEIEYINNVTTNITFQIDVMQTWMFEVELKECMVEREHSATDNILENLTPEPIEVTQYVTEKVETLSELLFGAYSVIIQCSADLSDSGFSYTGGGFYDGVFSGVNYYHFPISTDAELERVREFLSAVENTPDGANSIVSIYMIPYFVGTAIRATPTPYQTACASYNRRWFNGTFTPKNKKMYTSPYNFLYIHCGDDEGNNYKYEYLGVDANGNHPFKMFTSAIANPQIHLVPNFYLGVNDNFQNRVVMDGFPQCAVNVDSYKQYIANQGSAPAIRTVTNVMGATAGATALLTGGSSLAIAGGIITITNSIANIASMFNELNIEKNKPPITKGSQSSAVLVGHKKKNFYFEQRITSLDDAERIDNYFTVFGYATNRIKKPNRNVRPHWTYVKTLNSDVFGSVPISELSAINKVYNTGITFWKNGDEIGNYTLDNSV